MAIEGLGFWANLAYDRARCRRLLVGSLGERGLRLRSKARLAVHGSLALHTCRHCHSIVHETRCLDESILRRASRQICPPPLSQHLIPSPVILSVFRHCHSTLNTPRFQ